MACDLRLTHRMRRVLLVSLLIAALTAAGSAVNAQGEQRLAQLVWSDFQAAAVLRISVTCKTVSINQHASAGRKSIGSAFLLGHDIVVSARHLVLACSDRKIDATDKLSQDELAQGTESASRNLEELIFEHPGGEVNQIKALDGFQILAANDFAYFQLPKLLAKSRPRLCLARTLNFSRGQAVTMYGYASGNIGRSLDGSIQDPRDSAKLAESDMNGGAGWSGAPVTNSKGRVVGMTVARTATGHALILPLAQAAHLLAEEVRRELPEPGGTGVHHERSVLPDHRADVPGERGVLGRAVTRGDAPLRRIAIVDDRPGDQYLLPEFLLFQRLFERHGIAAVVCDPAELRCERGGLWHDGQPVDLVYNRHTDFALDEPAHAALRAAWDTDAAVITPHPRAHALYADKRNLVRLSDPYLLRGLGVDAETQAVLGAGVPRTEAVTPDRAEALWAARRGLFFKPASGFGSRGAYRGDKLTRRVFAEILAGDYIAQALVPPSERRVTVDGAAVEDRKSVV